MRLPPIEAGAAESPWRRLRLGLAAVVWLASATAALAQSLENLTIRTASGSHAFAVEVVRTPEERAIGLMNRRFLPADRGMLFDFGEAAPVSMWMKNTYIALDMLFIGKDGRIRSIKENAEPLSEAIIDSKGPIDYVLELNGGTVKRLGIRTGNRVENELIDSLRKTK